MASNNDILTFMDHMHCEEMHMVVDRSTGLRAVVAIHNTQLGPSLGGCRWLEYDSTEKAAMDAIRLAQAMTHKAAISGLNLGGGKAVLLKPKGTIDTKAYFQSFGRFLNKLGGRYITAVDSGTSVENMDMIKSVTEHVTSTSDGVFSSADPSAITAYGVVRGIEAGVKFKMKRDTLEGIRVAVQGVGHVGYHLVEELHKRKAIVSITDLNSIATQKCVDQFQVSVANNMEQLLAGQYDVFAPCALGGVITDETISQIKCGLLIGAANNVLSNPEKHAEELHQRGILYAPDFLVNAGGLIYVAGQYEKISEQKTRDRVTAIYDTLLSVFLRTQKENKNTWEIAHTMALERVQNAG